MFYPLYVRYLMDTMILYFKSSQVVRGDDYYTHENERVLREKSKCPWVSLCGVSRTARRKGALELKTFQILTYCFQLL